MPLHSSWPAGCVALAIGVATVQTVAAARTPGAIVDYAFYRHECLAGSAAELANPTSPSRALNLNMSSGVDCLDGRQGVELESHCAYDYTTPPNCTYSPVAASIVDGVAPAFAAGIVSGFTIDMWLAAREWPSKDTAWLSTDQQVLLSLVHPTPELTGSHTSQSDRCRVVQSDGTVPVSFELLQNRQGCVSIRFLFASGKCLTIPADDVPDGANALAPCPASARLNMSDGTPQHLVVSINGASLSSASPATLPRFATYIDGARIVDSELGIAADPRGDDAAANLAFFVSQRARMAALNFTGLWDAAHVLRVGTDAYGGKRSSGNGFLGEFYAWSGRVHSVSLYSRPLDAAEGVREELGAIEDVDVVVGDVREQVRQLRARVLEHAHRRIVPHRVGVRHARPIVCEHLEGERVAADDAWAAAAADAIDAARAIEHRHVLRRRRQRRARRQLPSDRCAIECEQGAARWWSGDAHAARVGRVGGWIAHVVDVGGVEDERGEHGHVCLRRPRKRHRRVVIRHNLHAKRRRRRAASAVVRIPQEARIGGVAGGGGRGEGGVDGHREGVGLR